MKLPFTGQFTVTQKFGENPDYYRQFGINGHDGLDWACPEGTPIVAAESGRVIQISPPRDFGNFVAIWHPAAHLISWYCHLQSSSVALGSVVSKRQRIGLSNNTGNSRGTHLHFALSQTDNDGQIINKGNKFAGFINPLPFFQNDLVSNVTTRITSLRTFFERLKPIKTWLWEGIKTSGRFTLMVFLSALVDTLTKTLAGVKLPDSTKWMIALSLAGLDRAIHEWRKDNGTEGAWKGLVGF